MQPAVVMQKIYAYLGVPEFTHNFDKIVQVTQEDDLVFGVPGLHEIRPKVEPLQNDYLDVLGRAMPCATFNSSTPGASNSLALTLVRYNTMTPRET